MLDSRQQFIDMPSGTAVAGSDAAMPAGACSRDALLLQGGTACPSSECLPEEVAVAFEINGISQVVMLATPADLEDFALGFLLTEALIDSPAQLLETEPEQRAEGIVLHLRVTARCEEALRQQRRLLAGRTGCGICGVDKLEAVQRDPVRPLRADARVSAPALQRALRELATRQPLQRSTGATHGAAWCDSHGAARIVREDIGRHNALDKLVGALTRSGIDAARGLIAVTSRASVEMVQKTAAAGVAVLAARSAPTQLAVQAAERAGMLLAGYVREGRATIYAGAQRLAV